MKNGEIIRRFDESGMVAKLGEMSPDGRVIFAAACAQRLMPAYAGYSKKLNSGSVTIVGHCLEKLWDDVGRAVVKPDDWQAEIDSCMRMMPPEGDELSVVEHAIVEDAVAAVAFALRCRKTGEAKEAMWAARRIYEALDQNAIVRLNIDLNRPGAEFFVLSDSLVQAELERQDRDLRELRVTLGDPRSLAETMRNRAREEGRALLGATAPR